MNSLYAVYSFSVVVQELLSDKIFFKNTVLLSHKSLDEY